jgi:hypothetical protein
MLDGNERRANMSDAPTATATADEELVLAAVENEVASIQRSLEKEGAGIEVEVDPDASKLIVSLVRNRIVCEGCLLPEHLVKTMLTRALKTSGLKYTLETRNWILG